MIDVNDGFVSGIGFFQRMQGNINLIMRFLLEIGNILAQNCADKDQNKKIANITHTSSLKPRFIFLIGWLHFGIFGF